MFSASQRREISEAVQKILRNTEHPELPDSEIKFLLTVHGKKSLSWALIKNNGGVNNPTGNSHKDEQARSHCREYVHGPVYIDDIGDVYCSRCGTDLTD